jgi:hypothetical protein
MGKFNIQPSGRNNMSSRIYNFNKNHPQIFSRPLISGLPSIPGLTFCKDCQDTTQVNSHHAKAFVLSCIDFRLRDNITYNLTNLGYKNEYDDSAVAGGSLGYNGLLHYNWSTTITDNIDLAIQLHDIEEILLIDHMQCGAYGSQYPTMVKGSNDEYNYHISNLNIAAQSLKIKYPDLIIKKYIISIDGGTMIDIDIYKGQFPF